MASAATRPVIFVLAGVNGSGKSSLGGALLAEHGLTWFNPDSYARELVQQTSLPAAEANARAWNWGRRQLEQAIAQGTHYAFETTLGGQTIRDLLLQAARTHDVVMIFCGLASVELHFERVALRVRHGGHDIPHDKIRERWTASRRHLIELLPALARLQVFDNSAPADAKGRIPDPLRVLEMERGRVQYPGHNDAQARAVMPLWAHAIVEAALLREAGG
jgi:predicted ABC-type ATPase